MCELIVFNRVVHHVLSNYFLFAHIKLADKGLFCFLSAVLHLFPRGNIRSKIAYCLLVIGGQQVI